MTFEQLRCCFKKTQNQKKNTELLKNTYSLKCNLFILIYLHHWENLLWHFALNPPLIDSQFTWRQDSSQTYHSFSFLAFEEQLSGSSEASWLSFLSILLINYYFKAFLFLAPSFRMYRC